MIDLIKIDDKVLDLEKLPPDQQEKIRNFAKLYILKDQAVDEIKAGQVNLDKLITQWLKNKQSKHTRAAYRKAVADWLEYLDRAGVKHPLLARAENADAWISELKEKDLANNTILLKARAVSSFYSTLRRYRHVSVNPFYGAPAPKKEYKKRVDPDGDNIPIMNEKEYQEFIKELEARIKGHGNHISIKHKRENAKMLLPVVHFLGEYGLRSGAVSSIELKGDHFSFTTKGGKKQTLELKPETKKIIKRFRLSNKPFKDIELRRIQGAIKRLSEKLKNENKIKHIYTSHDFRHYFAVKYYQETKDIVRLKDLLGHASINVTDIYLQSINLK